MYIIKIKKRCRLHYRKGRGLLFVTVWMVCGSFIMPVIMQMWFQDLKRKSIVVMTGRIFMYRHISRWKDMMHRSMRMFSIHGKDTRKFIRARFRRDLIRWQAMWNILLYRLIWKVRDCLFHSREQRVDWHSGWTVHLSDTVKILLPRQNLNWQIMWKKVRINWLHRYLNGLPAAGVRIRISSDSQEFTEMCTFTQCRILTRMTFRFVLFRKKIWNQQIWKSR